MMIPSDDYFTSPYGVIKATDNFGFLVFQCYKTREPHDTAAMQMDDPRPWVDSCPTSLMETLRLGKKSLTVFRGRTEAGYPSKDIDDKAMKTTCKKFGWDVPNQWRNARKELSDKLRVAPIIDLQKWDADAYFSETKSKSDFAL
jgi:hypothetical protein